MRREIGLLVVLLMMSIGGCIGGDGSLETGVIVDNQADTHVEVDVVIASEDSTIMAQHRDGSETAYHPSEASGQGLGDLDGAYVVDGVHYGTISAEPGEQSRLAIDDYDSDTYVVAIVHRRGDASTNFIIKQCDEGTVRMQLTAGMHTIDSKSEGCL